MNKELLIEEVNEVMNTLKNQDWVEEENLKIRQLTDYELKKIDVEISTYVYELVVEFLRSGKKEYEVGTLIKIRRYEDNEELYLLISENSDGNPIWLNLDLTLYCEYDPTFYDDCEVLAELSPNEVFNKIGGITDGI